MVMNGNQAGPPRQGAAAPVRLSVVIPLHDEAANIGPLLAEMTTALRDAGPYEIVCVNDGSRDATASVLRAAQRNRPNVRVLTHAQSCGQSSALRTGVQAARGTWVALIDGDGQNDPADIPALMALWQDPAHGPALQLVVGNRRGRRRDSWIKRVSSRMANTVRARLLGDATPDTGCGLKIMRRADFLSLPDFDHMHRFIPALVRRQGGTVISVPVHHRARRYGRSHYGTWQRLRVGVVDLLGVMWLLRRVQYPQVHEEGPL